ncbi:hypothetical protein [Vibrio phage phiKT1028]|nr:hypothetical protein [Vibrio phage phiKT1028]
MQLINSTQLNIALRCLVQHWIKEAIYLVSQGGDYSDNVGKVGESATCTRISLEGGPDRGYWLIGKNLPFSIREFRIDVTKERWYIDTENPTLKTILSSPTAYSEQTLRELILDDQRVRNALQLTLTTTGGGHWEDGTIGIGYPGTGREFVIDKEPRNKGEEQCTYELNVIEERTAVIKALSKSALTSLVRDVEQAVLTIPVNTWGDTRARELFSTKIHSDGYVGVSVVHRDSVFFLSFNLPEVGSAEFALLPVYEDRQQQLMEIVAYLDSAITITKDDEDYIEGFYKRHKTHKTDLGVIVPNKTTLDLMTAEGVFPEKRLITLY